MADSIPASRRAASSVYGVPELLDSILRLIPSRQLFPLQRVNKQFRDQIRWLLDFSDYAMTSLDPTAAALRGRLAPVATSSYFPRRELNDIMAKPFHIFRSSGRIQPAKCGRIPHNRRILCYLRYRLRNMLDDCCHATPIRSSRYITPPRLRIIQDRSAHHAI